MNFDNCLSLLLGLPKTIYINFKYLKFKDAMKLPILISHRVWLKKTAGRITINAPIYRGMIKIGFGGVGTFDIKRSRSIFEVSGTITFNGKAGFGHGSKICVAGDLFIGNNFLITAESSIICFKKITIGDDCLFSWDILIMDTDFHKIKSFNGEVTNLDKEIVIGSKVWISCRCTILKGSSIGDEIVIAANSCVYGKIEGNNKVISSFPVKVIKDNIYWEI